MPATIDLRSLTLIISYDRDKFDALTAEEQRSVEGCGEAIDPANPVLNRAKPIVSGMEIRFGP